MSFCSWALPYPWQKERLHRVSTELRKDHPWVLHHGETVFFCGVQALDPAKGTGPRLPVVHVGEKFLLESHGSLVKALKLSQGLKETGMFWNFLWLMSWTAEQSPSCHFTRAGKGFLRNQDLWPVVWRHPSQSGLSTTLPISQSSVSKPNFEGVSAFLWLEILSLIF